MARLRAIAKSSVERVLARLPHRIPRCGRLVLAYHNVVPDNFAGIGEQSLHLSASKFEAQVSWLRRQADVVSLVDLITAPASRDRLVAITFDDAYRSALSRGVGYLSAERLSSTVFVAPGLLDTVPVWDRRAMRGWWTHADRERFLWSDLGRSYEPSGLSTLDDLTPEVVDLLSIATESDLHAALKSAYVVLGNHTWSHPNLAAISYDEALLELSHAQDWIQQRFGSRSIPAVAYPFGLIPNRSAPLLTAAGLDDGFLVDGGWYVGHGERTHWDFPRWNVAAGVSECGFQARFRRWMQV